MCNNKSLIQIDKYKTGFTPMVGNGSSNKLLEKIQRMLKFQKFKNKKLSFKNFQFKVEKKFPE